MVSDLVVPATGLELTVSAPGRRATGQSVVMVKRFATVFALGAIATLKGDGSITVKPARDADPLPWRIRIDSPDAVEAWALARA